MHCISIINQKGGVGKTTTAANLGAGLAARGHRVLLLDLDAQANLTMHLSLEDLAPAAAPGDGGGTIFDVLLDGVPLLRAIQEIPKERLFLVRGSEDLAGIEQALAGKIGRELLLRGALTELEKSGAVFDYVLMDCPPSLGILSLNALAAAGQVLIPLQTEFFALQGMAQLFEVIDVVRRRLNSALTVLGILPCLVDQRTKLSAEVVAEISRHFGELLLLSRIRRNVKLAEAPGFGMSVLGYAPGSPGAEDYLALTVEVEDKLREPRPRGKPSLSERS
ncbi:MAG: ParA family protein [Planctomycetota bacterium]